MIKSRRGVGNVGALRITDEWQLSFARVSLPGIEKDVHSKERRAFRDEVNDHT